MRRLFEFAPQILAAFKKRNQRRLRKLNDKVLKTTALEPTKVNLSLAVFSYVLSKIVSKPRLLRREYEPRLLDIEQVLEKLVRRMQQASEDELLEIFSELEKAIIFLEEKDPRFLLSLVNKGKLKMAATFYAQGMSLGLASEMTGLEKQEIMDYAGHTMMFDRVKEEKSVTERMKDARRLLSG